MAAPLSLAWSSAPMLFSLMDGDAGPDDGVGGNKYGLKRSITMTII